MSKGQKRSNREAKKPKQNKPKKPPAGTTHSISPKPDAVSGAKFKWR